MSTPKPTVLFVEDSDLDFELASCAIRRLDRPVDVVRVSSHRGFREFVSRGTDRPALVVMDIRLPDASGLDIAREIRERGLFPPETPVVVFSTSDVPSDLEAARQLGVEGFQTKPLDASQYVDVVQQMVQRWVVPQERSPSPRSPAALSGDDALPENGQQPDSVTK